MARYDPADSYDHGTGPAPHAWQVARDPGIELAAWSPEDRAGALDALATDLAGNDFISTTCRDCEPGDGA